MTAGGANETPVPGITGVADGRPTLSPDGERVAYTRVVNNRQTIFRVNLDGSGELRLRVGTHPRWSPGGRNMVFISPTGRISTMRVARGHIFHRHMNVRAASVDWRPDGHRVVYASRGGDLFMIEAKHDNVPRRLTNTRRGRVRPGVVARLQADRVRARAGPRRGADPLRRLHDARAA